MTWTNPRSQLSRSFFSALALAWASVPGARAAGQPVQGAVLVVPGTLPLSGPDSASGAAFKEAYELAVAEVNARGGLAVGGQHLTLALDLVDDRGDKAAAAHAAERLIDKHHASFLLGTSGNAAVAAQSSVAELHHVNYVAPSGSSAKTFRRGFRFLFGLQAPLDALAQSELEWVAERQAAGELPRPARLSVAADASPAWAELQKAVLAYVQRNPQGFEIVSAGADVALSDAPSGPSLALHRPGFEHDGCPAAVTYASLTDDRAGGATAESTSASSLLKAVWWNERLSGNPESAAFVKAFRLRYHRGPGWEQALAYEAARALFLAIEQANTVDAEVVRGRLAALHMRSLVPGGELSFPAASGQQAHYPFLLLQQMPDGSSTIVSPAFAATASLEPDTSGRCRQLAAAR